MWSTSAGTLAVKAIQTCQPRRVASVAAKPWSTSLPSISSNFAWLIINISDVMITLNMLMTGRSNDTKRSAFEC